MLFGGLVQRIAVVDRTPSGAATQDSSLTSGIAGEQQNSGSQRTNHPSTPDAPCEQGVKRSARVSFPEPVDGTR